MAISSVAVGAFEQVSQSSVDVNQRTSQANGGEEVEKSVFEQRRDERNKVILEANYSVSLSSKDNPNSTLFKRAIDAINKELEPTLGKNAAQKAYDSDMDFSPEATAERIVGFATAFFPLYQQNHQGEGLEQQLDDFLDLVGGGAEKGFGEAKDILTGLDVFNGEVEENANATYDLIVSGFDKFKQNVLDAADPERAAARLDEQSRVDELKVESGS
jgi:hypothetical protein